MNIEESIEILESYKESLEEYKDNPRIIQAIGTLLTAYEKEKEKNKELTDEYLVQRDLINPDFLKDYIHKDKIKAKIEPKLKELDEQMKKEWKEYGNSREYQDMEDEWNFLQSLLEKE